MADTDPVFVTRQLAEGAAKVVLAAGKIHPKTTKHPIRPPDPSLMVELELTEILVGCHFAKAKIVVPLDTFDFTGDEPIDFITMSEEYYVKGYAEENDWKWVVGDRAMCFRINGYFLWGIPKSCYTTASEEEIDTAREQSNAALLALFGVTEEE